MDEISRQRRRLQRPPDSRAAGGGLSAGIGHQPDHGGQDGERELKALVVLAPATALGAIACGTGTAPSPQTTTAQGEGAYQKCYSCHALEPGAATLDGPTLRGVVWRPIAGEAGFDYSPALREFAERNPRWTPELLDRYVADPEALVPGTSMNFPGISDAAERKALIDYLERAAGRAP